jgi:hypothetical protein
MTLDQLRLMARQVFCFHHFIFGERQLETEAGVVVVLVCTRCGLHRAEYSTLAREPGR